ncbi:hypothetical protein FHL15_010777 [Xylaria flabelliformis]|uniref:glycine--tRNA ligase n=1 Tax=Xylaria flabelliformis TaxID=2512241 RepID=A0A553HK67_9PEZI|nr:hypothetical protein FHL15_010777 [Xylaria flabelliformis]
MTTTMTTLKGQPLDRLAVDGLLRRRMFYTPSFDIYGGISGLFDYGPPGTALQSNILDVWRKHFVLEDNVLEVDCTVLTPHIVFKTSGHVDRFSDWMCKDPKSGVIMRADHFVEDVLEARLRGDKEARGQATSQTQKDPKRAAKAKAKGHTAVKLDDAVVQEYESVLAQIDNYDDKGLAALIQKYDLRCASGELPTPPVAFNLMFKTSIGPSSNTPGYLRPETAQGQFLNFAKLLEFNQNVMPFASASIGKSYRNEISPRGGLLRVRELSIVSSLKLAAYSNRFHQVENVELELLPRETQLSGKTNTTRMSIGKAVADGIVDNETLGYFLARINLFLQKIGVDPKKTRFRQHLAHYACDCWDAELLTSSGWVECVGCADRSAYDLSVHSKQTEKPLLVRQQLEQPRTVTSWEIDLNRKLFGPLFKKNARAVEAVLMAASQEQRESFGKELESTGKVVIDVAELGPVEINNDVLKCELRTSSQNVREYIPNVIEPSFGIGRIIFALCEHNYWVREGDEARSVLSFPPIVAPTKVLIVPLSNDKKFLPYMDQIGQKLRNAQISSRVDVSSATIGKRYSRNDELGTALGVTVDFQTLKDGSITLRDRDTTRQVRADQDKVLAAIQEIVNGGKTWADIENDLPAFTGQDQ